MLEKKKSYKLDIYPLASNLCKAEKFGSSCKWLNNQFKKYNISAHLIISPNIFVNTEMNQTVPVIAFYLITGGTEKICLNHIEEQKKRIINKKNLIVLLISHPFQNSMPSALEAKAALINTGHNCFLCHLSLNTYNDISLTSRSNLLDYIHCFAVRNALKDVRLGVIGEPSLWLVASGKPNNQNELKETWGISLVDIPTYRLTSQSHTINSKEHLKKYFLQNSVSSQLDNITLNKRLEHATGIYNCLLQLIQEFSLNSITIRCFDLLSDIEESITGCLPVSHLNDLGIITGCEGDIPAVITMILLYLLSNGTNTFMANPQDFNDEENIINFAHCTIARSLCDDFIIDSHFESEKGLGIRATKLKDNNSQWTIARINLNNNTIHTTEGIASLPKHDPNRCRTQITIQLNKDIKASDYINKMSGNHHILIPGCYSSILKQFEQLFLCHRY